MTVAENLVLARDNVPAVVNWAKETRSSKRSWRGCRSRCRSTRRVPTSRPARSKNAKSSNSSICKRRFLILDEPTSVLTPREADEVLGMLRGMSSTAT